MKSLLPRLLFFDSVDSDSIKVQGSRLFSLDTPLHVLV